MAFVNTFRMERVYFERLKSMIDILKPYLNTETDEKLKSILENSIDDNGAILLLYRNLGECWAELSDLIKKADEKIDSLDDKTEKYHDELNERIDEVNNYIMAIIREIEARLEAVEQDLATLPRNIILDLQHSNDDYTLYYNEEPVDFAQLAEWVEFPDNVIVRGVVNGEETVFHLREFDTDDASGVFEFFATGLINDVVHEITVTVLPDDSVNVATEIQTIPEYSGGSVINIDNYNVISLVFPQNKNVEYLADLTVKSVDMSDNYSYYAGREIAKCIYSQALPYSPFYDAFLNGDFIELEISRDTVSPINNNFGYTLQFGLRARIDASIQTSGNGSAINTIPFSMNIENVALVSGNGLITFEYDSDFPERKLNWIKSFGTLDRTITLTLEVYNLSGGPSQSDYVRPVLMDLISSDNLLNFKFKIGKYVD